MMNRKENRDILSFSLGEIIQDVSAHDISSQGYGVSRINNFVIFTKGLGIDESADIQIVKRQKNFAIAKVIKMHHKTQSRVEPKCPYFLECGGCKLQHLNQESQLKLKQDWISKEFDEEIGITTSSQQYYYRNKINLFVENSKLGLMDERQQFIEIEECLIVKDSINQTIQIISKLIQSVSIPELKRVVVRTNNKEDSIMVIFVLNIDNPNINEVADKLYNSDQRIISIIKNIGDNENYLLNDNEIIIKGVDSIKERVFDYPVNITSQSFFQVNHDVMEMIYEDIIKYGKFEKTNRVGDLFSGLGTIALSISNHVHEVIGLEINQQAVDSGNKTMRDLGIDNIKLKQVNLNHGFKDYNFDTLIVDPPRSGLGRHLIHQIIDSEIEDIIYVSCNPKTLNEDLKQLKRMYDITFARAYDMFPQTNHLESMIILTRK